MSDDAAPEETSIEETVENHDYQTLAHGHLSPRHRRLALLAAEGKSNADICTALGYCGSRVSILLKNPYVVEEITRLRNKIYEETIGARLKNYAEPALKVVEYVLNDRTNRVKVSEKIDVAKWVLESVNGKAVQRIEAGENMLAALMDRLDAQKTRPLVQHIHIGQKSDGAIDVTPAAAPQISASTPSEEELLEAWALDFERQA